MTINVDPNGSTAAALHQIVEFEGRRVLEIGCGDGHLTWRYADKASPFTTVWLFG